MKIKDLLLEGNKYVHKDQSKLILSTILEYNPLELTLRLDDEISKEIEDKFLKCIKNIKNGIPIQYALNSVNFYGLDFYVDERVLIPRFETEELVYNTDLYLKKYFNNNIKILDLGTGSGCIGLTLKHLNNNYDLTCKRFSIQICDALAHNPNKLEKRINYLKSIANKLKIDIPKVLKK